MNRRLIPAVLVAGLVAAAGPVAAANAAPPSNANGAPPSDAGGGGTLENFCNFDDVVAYTVTGKTKLITKPDGQRTITSPGQRITLSANGKTVSYVITGTRFERDVVVSGEKITEVEVKGRNILINQIGTTETPGIFLVVGNFDFALDADGFEVPGRGFNPDGPGQVTDVCRALS
ncbi:hypothetical protein [Pseudarthrobacter sp. PvP090]|uniref:hypothetical protein n=1 Tax=Pseudarthrobacter sp. PvP090 TaxID=3156393 RepID=UPI00339AC75C